MCKCDAAGKLLLRWVSVVSLTAAFPFAQVQGAPTPAPTKRPAVLGEMDFTPRKFQITSGGAKVPVNYVLNGTVPVRLGAPGDWQTDGSKAELFFTSQRYPTSRITIRASSVPIPEKIDDAWVAATKSLLPRLAPGGSKNVQVVSVVQQSVNLPHGESCQFKMSYDFAGQRYSTGVTFMKGLSIRLLEMICSSREADFVAVQGVGNSIMSGWTQGPIQDPGPE